MRPEFRDDDHRFIWNYLTNHFQEVKQDIRELRNRDWLIFTLLATLIIGSVVLARLL